MAALIWSIWTRRLIAKLNTTSFLRAQKRTLNQRRFMHTPCVPPHCQRTRQTDRNQPSSSPRGHRHRALRTRQADGNPHCCRMLAAATTLPSQRTNDPSTRELWGCWIPVNVRPHPPRPS
jgi:hypothetical protein